MEKINKAMVEHLDDLCRRLQDDYNGIKEFEQYEEDRLVVYNVVEILEKSIRSNDKKEYFINNSGEEIVGYVENIIEKLKEEIIYQIKEINLFKGGNIEIIGSNVNMIMDLLDTLYQDISDKKIDSFTIIKIFYNPMGSYSYRAFKEVL